jgi:hypothetical protein
LKYLRIDFDELSASIQINLQKLGGHQVLPFGSLWHVVRDDVTCQLIEPVIHRLRITNLKLQVSGLNLLAQVCQLTFNLRWRSSFSQIVIDFLPGGPPLQSNIGRENQ